MQQTHGTFGALPGLPDPVRDAQFYDGVPTRRFAAWLIDLVVILIVGVPVAIVFGVATIGIGFALFPFIVATVGFLYRTATIAGGSATWGMRVMGIELRRHDGSRFDATTAVLHTMIYTLALWTVVLQLLSCLTILFSAHRQGLNDIILRTTAINRPAE